MEHEIQYNNILLTIHFEPYYYKDLDYIEYKSYNNSVAEHYKQSLDYIEIENILYKDKLEFYREIKNISQENEEKIIEILTQEEENWKG